MKTRILSYIIVFFLLAGLVPPVQVHAAPEMGGGVLSTFVTWHYDGRGTLDICGTGSIPDYGSKSQPWSAFVDEIKTVRIQQGITEIGNNAFAGCTRLTNVEIPESVEYINNGAFSGCTALEAVELPLALDWIYANAFSGCASLQKIVFHSYMPTIADSAFSGVTAEARYPASAASWTGKTLGQYGGTLTWVAADGAEEFLDCGAGSFGAWGIRNDGTMVMTPGYSNMPDYSQGGAPWYKYKDKVTNLEIHGEFQTIGAYAFADFSKLKRVDLDGTMNIKAHAFDGCSALESVRLMSSHGYMTIYEYAFRNCKALKQLHIPTAAQTKDYAFSGCTALKEIYLNVLSGSSTSISGETHSYQSVNATIYYPKGVKHYGSTSVTQYGGSFTWEEVTGGRCGSDAWWSYDTDTCTLTISGTGPISSHFSGNYVPWGMLREELLHVIVEDGITEIPSYTFEYQGMLQDVRLPETLRVMGPNAFNDCESLNNILIPGSFAAFTYNDKFNRCGAMTDLYYAGTAEQWESIPYHENAEGVSSGNTFNIHFLEYHESTVTCTQDGIDACYSFLEPTVYTHVYDEQGNRLEAPRQVPALGHDYDAVVTEPTCTQSGCIIYTCARCADRYTEHPAALGHDFGEWVLTVPATCQQEGEQIRECSRCAATESCSIAMTDHLFESYASDNNATCTEDGTRTSKCTTCDLTNTVADLGTALGHAFTVYTSNADASCEEDGTKISICDRCDAADIVADPGSRLGHAYSAVITRPTCVRGGYTTYSCQRCDDAYVSDETQALGHSFTHYVSDGNANCEADGTKTAKCDRCQQTDTIPDMGSATGHSCGDWYDVTPATCTEDGAQRRDCESCDYYENRITAAYGHSYSEEVKAPTCTKEGYTIHTCSHCGDSYTSDTTQALGHDHIATVTSPTCTDWGYTMYICSRCGDSYANAFVPALEHDWLETKTEPTCTEHGFTTHSCYRCGESYVDSETEALGHDFRGERCVRCGAEEVVIAFGLCGAQATWTMYGSGRLLISGEGRLKDYTYKSEMPWYPYFDQITSVVLEEGVTSIGDYAFYGMPNLLTISIPESVTTIGEYAFKNCTVLDDVKLPSQLNKLGESAFYACSGLTAIEIPASLWTIQPYTFKNCTALAEVIFHEGNLMKISDGAFYNTAVTELVLPDCLSILDVYSFKNCAKLESITLGSGLSQIREAVFYGTAIPTIEIPEGVTSIGPYAFKNCVALETIELPETLSSVGEASFYACTNLQSLELPDAVTTIGSYAFRKCAELRNVTFSDSLENIGESSFYGCESLFYLYIPENVTTIQGYAFKGCLNLGIVELPDSLKTLGESAFHTCTGLDEITIPGGVTKVGEYCFSGSTGIDYIYFLGDAPAIGEGAFNKLTATAYYPRGNATWTSAVRQNYGGSITWMAQ